MCVLCVTTFQHHPVATLKSGSTTIFAGFSFK